MHNPGTTSSLKQLLQNSFMKRIVENHSCQNHIHYSPDKNCNSRECNSLIYIYKNDTHEIFKIILKQDDSYLCHPHGRYTYKNNLVPNINWSQVGVYIKGPLSSETVMIEKSQIQGKVISVQSFLITCPNNVLREK